MKAKFQAGTMFRLSKVMIDNKSAPQYIGADVKVDVDLDKTTSDPILQGMATLQSCPTPAATCAKLVKLQGRRRFDILAVVHTASQPKERMTPGGAKSVIDVTLIDDSRADDGKPCQMHLSVWKPPTDVSRFVAGNVVLIRNLQAQRKAGAVTVSSTETTEVFDLASHPKLESWSRCEHLKEQAAMLCGLTDDATNAVSQRFIPQGQKWPFDVATSEATLTTCALLDAMSESPNLGNEGPRLMQAHNVRVEPPSGRVLTEDGERLWFIATFRDYSGSVQAAMNETTALAVTGAVSKDDFVQLMSQQELRWPLFNSIRFVRTVKPLAAPQDSEPPLSSESQPAAGMVVNLMAVAAMETPPTVQPTTSALALSSLLTLCPESTDGIVPTLLEHIQPCPFHGMLVGQDGQACKSAHVLVNAWAKSTLSHVGSGHLVRTTDVKDALGESAGSDGGAAQPAGAPSFILNAFCSLDDVLDFKLDPRPAKGGGLSPRMAEVVISGMVNGEFTVEAMRPIVVEDQNDARARFKTLLNMAVSTSNRSGEKRKVDWPSPETTPLSTKRCRALDAWPSSPDCRRAL